MDFEIKSLARRHISEAARIEKCVFKDEPWSESAFLSELDLKTAVDFAAVCGGAVAGYIIASVAADEGCINNFAVSPDFIRRGIGSALLNAALAEMKSRGASLVALEVRLSNKAAKKIYEKAGFKPVGIRKRFYKNPTEDACLMILKF